MKVTSLLLAVMALSSCVAKPWFVGSVNDHYTMYAYAAGDAVELPDIGDPDYDGDGGDFYDTDYDSDDDTDTTVLNGHVVHFHRKGIKGHHFKSHTLGGKHGLFAHGGGLHHHVSHVGSHVGGHALGSSHAFGSSHAASGMKAMGGGGGGFKAKKF